ncbi:MAG: toll/interleukin-1 receptor domain-containing protein [Rhodocyclaceae bacterium]|nr:toll/interleukin-1 receptor domain-containing protein [Rhodocyclaceae bacterium]
MLEGSLQIGAIALLAMMVLAVIAGLRASREGVAIGALLLGGVLGVIGVASLLNWGTNGRVAPAESTPWLSLGWITITALIVRRRRRAGLAMRAPTRPSATSRGAEPPPMPRRGETPSIFLSYRRSDSQDVTGRLYDRLVQHFGRDHVFKDVDNIPLGVDFRRFIGEQVGRCDVLLAVIGPSWLDARNDQGERRLDEGRDLVRVEIAAALKRDIPVVPILIGGAAVPASETLPEELRALSDRNGIQVRPDPDFHRDVDLLVDGLGRLQTAPSRP